MSSTKSAHALVFGASGLAGWGVVDQLLSNYPFEGTFSKVTALANRPLNVEDSYWPSPSLPKLNLVSGINLTSEGFAHEFASKVEDLGSVTHVFYFAYKPVDDTDLERAENRAMLKRVVDALNTHSSNLEFIVFPGGTKSYGITVIGGGVFKPPYKESMILPESYGRLSIYEDLRDVLREGSEGRKWTWCEVRPDAVVGFTPNGSAFNLVSHWANYLSAYALVQGRGAKVSYPGSEEGYASEFNDASAEMIAKFSIWASLHPEKTGGGEIFNIADQEKPSSMRERWPAFAAYFGLEGVGPDLAAQVKPGEYLNENRGVLEKAGVKVSEVFKGNFLDNYGYYLTFDRYLSLEKARSVGFEEEKDPNLSWFRAFDQFKEAGMIPK